MKQKIKAELDKLGEELEEEELEAAARREQEDGVGPGNWQI